MVRFDIPSELPVDPILRPRPIFIPGAVKHPQGWKLRAPPIVFQIYSSKGYKVTAQHIPGEEWITLNWRINPPSWEEFIKVASHFAEKVDFENDEVRQQVFSFFSFFTSIFFPSLSFMEEK
jgi:hypothetical protein